MLRLLVEGGLGVTVVPTDSALKFVGRATWEALSGRPVLTSVFESVPDVAHVRIGQRADIVVVAPATADILARAAAGMADDLLTATLLTARCPVIFVPAMHTEMWENPATRANVATLRSRGAIVLDPAVGRLTGVDTGPGRLPEPEQIHAAVLAHLGKPSVDDLAGRHVLITAGGTREPLDPVRFITNRSSGKQGLALAGAALARGAAVTLVAANVELPMPVGAQVLAVETAAQLADATLAAAPDVDAVVMAAAVADYRPAQQTDSKRKKVDGDNGMTLELVTNPDILKALVGRRSQGQVIVGFAAETGDATATVLEHGRAKLRRKGCDLLAVNEVGPDKGFGTSDNDVMLISATGEDRRLTGSKLEVAHGILSAVAEQLSTNR